VLQAELGAALESETAAAIKTTSQDKQGVTHLGLRCVLFSRFAR